MNQITLCIAIVVSFSWLGQASAQTSVDIDSRFLAVDVLGAWNRYVVTAAEVAGDDRVFHGWPAGATVRYSKPWFGIRTDVGRTARGEERINHLLIGPQVTTPYGSVSGVRVFACVGRSCVSAAADCLLERAPLKAGARPPGLGEIHDRDGSYPAG